MDTNEPAEGEAKPDRDHRGRFAGGKPGPGRPTVISR